MSTIQLTEVRGDPVADTRVLAEHLGIQHKNAYEMVKKYAGNFEQLGILRFETEEIKGRGQPRMACVAIPIGRSHQTHSQGASTAAYWLSTAR